MSNIIKNFKLFEDSFSGAFEPDEMNFTDDEIDNLNKSEDSISTTEEGSYEELLNSIKDL